MTEDPFDGGTFKAGARIPTEIGSLWTCIARRIALCCIGLVTGTAGSLRMLVQPAMVGGPRRYIKSGVTSHLGDEHGAFQVTLGERKGM
jgi:hypothetical protein